MVKLAEAVEAVRGRAAYKGSDYDDAKVEFVVVCDLMSDVLVVDRDNILLITSLVSRQALKTAHLVGAVAVVIVNDKAIPRDLIQLAEELDLSVILTSYAKFRSCVELGKLMGY